MQLFATLRIDDAEVDEIRSLMDTESRIDRSYRVELVDAEGVVHAEVDKVVQIRRKEKA